MGIIEIDDEWENGDYGIFENVGGKGEKVWFKIEMEIVKNYEWIFELGICVGICVVEFEKI